MPYTTHIAAALLEATVYAVFGDVIPIGSDVVKDFCFSDVIAGKASVACGEDSARRARFIGRSLFPVK